jgi:site-specific recombinase XerD
MPLPSLANWLGHASLKTTQVYIDGANPLLRADYEAAMNALSHTAECADEVVAYAAAPGPGAAAGENSMNYAPALDEPFIRQRLTNQPLWLADLIVEFIRHQQMRWKAYSRRRQAQQWLGEIRRTWQWLLEQQPMHALADLQKVALQEYLLHLHDTEASAHHINHIMTTFFAFLHFAEERGQSVSPALYRITRPQRGEDLPRPLTPTEFSRLERSVLSQTPTSAQERLDQAWFLVLADGGLRISELITLTVADWDSNRQALLIREPKFYRDRRLPLTNRAALAIDAHLQDRALAPEQPLLARAGCLLQPTYIRTQLHAFAQRTQLEQVTPHRLRHTFATRLLNSGKMPITSLQKLMGHRHLDTTMRYVKLYDATIQHDYQLAMATAQTQILPEPDLSIWGPTIQHSFEQPYDHSQPILYCV